MSAIYIVALNNISDTFSNFIELRYIVFQVKYILPYTAMCTDIQRNQTFHSKQIKGVFSMTVSIIKIHHE